MFKSGRDILVKLLPCRSQPHAPVLAFEQAYTKPLFQLFDSMTDGWLADAKLFCRTGKTQAAGSRFEDQQHIRGR